MFYIENCRKQMLTDMKKVFYFKYRFSTTNQLYFNFIFTVLVFIINYQIDK